MPEPTNGYCTLAQLQAALGESREEHNDALVRAINASSRLIDRWCGRRFYPDPVETTRYFESSGGRTLWLGPEPTAADVVSVSAIDTDGGAGTFTNTLTVDTDYHLAPRGAAEAGRGHDRIVFSAAPARGRGENVRVTGIFGWPAPPPEVVEATLIQSARVWKRGREAPFGVVDINIEGAGVRLQSKLDPDVELLLRGLRIPVVV